MFSPHHIERPVKRYRALFLSDFHMGSKAFDAKAMLQFLQQNESERLYLVGDIIDGWKFKNRWHWEAEYTLIIDELVRKAQNGTEIYYLPGNHDEELRDAFSRLKLRLLPIKNVHIRDKVTHDMLDGRRFVVLHGDQFDRRILRGPLSRWSDYIYDLFLELVAGHTTALKVNIKGEIRPFSLAKTLSKPGQWALRLINNFENAVYRFAKKCHADGVICGHTHIPVIKQIRGVTYANCGAWLRFGHTALAETCDGALELIDWPASHRHPSFFDTFWQQDPSGFELLPCNETARPITKIIIQEIEYIWPVKEKEKDRVMAWLPLDHEGAVNSYSAGYPIGNPFWLSAGNIKHTSRHAGLIIAHAGHTLEQKTGKTCTFFPAAL